MSLSDKQKRHYEILGERNHLRAERLKRARLASGVVSVSSNSKWLKVFDSLQTQFSSEAKSIVKLLKQDEPWEYRDILSSVFEDSYFDGMSGPLSYSEVEWLEIACDNPPEFEFEVDMEVGEGFVVIYGYRANHS